MGRTARVLLWIVVLLVVAIAALALLPSLLGSLMLALLVFALIDLAARRYRSGVRTLNSSLRAVSDQEGAIERVAIAFSRSGSLSGPCYEYARRLIAGEDAVEAAISSGVPLQLSTAISLYSAAEPGRKELAHHAEVGSSPSYMARELAMTESASMPVYGQFVYLMATALLTCLVMAFMGTFIMPTMEVMFEEFGMTMPLQGVFKAAPAVWVLVLLGFLMVICVPALNRLRWLGLRLPRWIPLTPKMAERRADMLVGLADGIDAGWPLGRTMALGHAISQSGMERRGLESAMRLVQQGIDPIEAICRIGWLDSKEAAWLSKASPQRAAQLLRDFAAQSVRDARENARWIMAILFPAVVIILGAIVLLYAVAFFGALTTLTNGLS